MVSVKVRDVVLTAVYLPVSNGRNVEEVEEELECLGGHVRWAKQEEMVIVGGDFNAHVGADGQRRGVCGKFGLRSLNHTAPLNPV